MVSYLQLFWLKFCLNFSSLSSAAHIFCLFLLDFMILIIYSEKYKLWSSYSLSSDKFVTHILLLHLLLLMLVYSKGVNFLPSLTICVFCIDTSTNFTMNFIILIHHRSHWYKRILVYKGACKSCIEYEEENLIQIHIYNTLFFI